MEEKVHRIDGRVNHVVVLRNSQRCRQIVLPLNEIQIVSVEMNCAVRAAPKRVELIDYV